MNQLLTSDTRVESWILQMRIAKIPEESTAKEGIPIFIIEFEHKEEIPEVTVLPKQEFWVADLGAHWEFSRKDIYEQVITHRLKHPNLRPEQK